MPDQNGGSPGTGAGPGAAASGPASSGGLFGGVFTRGGAVADDVAWLRALLAAEAGLARALERAGLAPAGAGASVTAAAEAAAASASAGGAAGGDALIAELSLSSALTGSPVPGLARALTRMAAGPGGKAAVHRGATSQDIMDTAAMLLARDAIDRVAADLAAAANAAAALAGQHRSTLMIGRTLLRQAVPVTFGMVAAGWLAGLDAALAGLAIVRDTRLAVQFGGAAGTLASLGADGGRVKSLMAEELGLADPPLPWHTERLRVIDIATAMARVTAALSKIARDITLLAQTEIGEVSEGPGGPGAPGRDGSPAMPDNGDPVAAVAILGCTRQVPGLLATLVAAAEQEHQRAAGAWHAEWQPFSHLLQLAASAAAWANDLLCGLRVDAARMAGNLAAAGGVPLAERVAALLRPSLGGQQARDLVAAAATRAAASGLPLRDVLLAYPELADRLAQAGVTPAQVEDALDPAGYLGASDAFITAALDARQQRQHG